MSTDRPTVAVVGGGITGLAAAWQLATAPGAPNVVVLEATARLGGKILTSADTPGLEYGPDAFLARVPHAVELCRELGLADELVAPATGRAFLWWRGALRPLPAGLVLGVPSDLPAVARSRIIGPVGLARAALDLVLPATRPRPGDAGADRDRSVGEIVTARFGRQIQERLVDPLLGGIHAGRSELLSARATAPQLEVAARAGRSLLLGLRRTVPAPAPAPTSPVFLSHPRGIGHIVGTLAERLAGAAVELRVGWPADAVGRDGGAWIVSGAAGTVRAEEVIVCTPAPAAAALLRDACAPAAAELAAIEHASVVVATFAYERTALPARFEGSGFLVPRPEGRLMTAATFMSSKWAHVDAACPGRIVVRVSAGRHRDERAWRLTDAELVSALHEELAEATGLTAGPVETTVTRWPEAFPQYSVGHLERVARVESALDAAPGLHAAGAALHGVGIPACIASGRQAADRALGRLRSGRAA